jgi:hypothetical protein
MSLRRSPVLTPASLAARRANALKSTGPRSVAGKARVALNALKHGHHARPLHPRLLRADRWTDAALYRRLQFALLGTFGPSDLAEYRDCQRMAAEAWCQFGGLRKPSGTKLESPFDSKANPLWYLEALGRLAGARSGFGGLPEPSADGNPLAGGCKVGSLEVRCPWHGLGLTFWVQRRRFWTPERLLSVVMSRHGRPDGLVKDRPLGDEWEDVVRYRIFPLLRPTLEERILYGLDRRGNGYSELLPACRRLVRVLREHGLWPLPSRGGPNGPEPDGQEPLDLAALYAEMRDCGIAG